MWKGGSACILGGYKIHWVDCKNGVSSVGKLIADKWVDKVIEVRRVNERMLVIRVMVGKFIPNLAKRNFMSVWIKLLEWQIPQ